MANFSTNNNILTLLNPRIVKKDNELFLTLLVCLGLQNDYSHSIFFKLNEKLLSNYNNNEIYSILNSAKLGKTKFANVLYNGFENYKFGEDYFISQSLYEYLSARTDNEESLLNNKIYENDIDSNYLDFILSIKNHDIDTFNNEFNRLFNYQLPENISFIHRNISNVDIISLAIKKIYDLPDETQQYEYSSIIDIFGLQTNGIYVLPYSNNANVELKEEIDNIIKDILEILHCKKEETGRYTIDLNQYLDDEKTNLISIDTNDKNYIMENFIIDEYLNVNKEYYDIISNTSIDRYYILQKALSRTFSIDELNNLYSTFFSIISEYTTINEFLYPNNIYRFVIDYFKNYQNDDGLNAIDIILGSTYTTTITNTNISNCSCKSSNNCLSTGGSSNNSSNGNIIDGENKSIDVSMMTCAEKYKAAMNQYLIDMLSNINFYCDWMWMESNLDDNEIEDIDLYTINGHTGLVPNEAMIDLLIKLLTEFLDLGYNLSSNKSTTKCGCHTSGCPDFSDLNLDKTHCSNCNIIENYIKVLQWTKEGKLEENKNKIYLYGKQFAHLLPGLIFN